MNLFRNKSLTLLELIIAITLMALVVLGFSSIDLFSRFQVLSSDRRARAQNEASLVLEHMTKEISKAVGSASISGQEAVSTAFSIDADTAIHARIDADGDGKVSSGDLWIAYRFTNTTYQIEYCPSCPSVPCITCQPIWGSSDENILSKKITAFIPIYNSSNNYVDISVTACDEPGNVPDNCGSRENPTVTLQTRIKIPAVSTN